jgi:hypothetical protein
MFRSFIDDSPELSVAVTDFIRRTVPVYRAISEDEHRAAVEHQLRMRLTALAERRPLGEAELAASAELAATRAAEGIPIDAVIAAYQAGDQEIWRLVVERGSPQVGPLMPELGRMMFAATSATTEVMARAHTRVARDIDGGRITLAHQFLELLDDPSEHAEATLAANRLGFDPNGEFVGFVWLSGDEALGASYEAASSLRSQSIGLAIRATGEGRFEMVAQADDAERLVVQITDRLRDGRLGVGVPRVGVEGASSSICDARLALEATSLKRPVVRFVDHWLESLALAESRRISVLTERGVTVAKAHPHLAETVVAFARADMSIATTAQKVHLHANSVTYRLNRWATLTGLDPRTFAGLAQSIIVCRIADQRS